MGHRVQYVSCIFLRNFYKCILVIHINGTDQAAGNTSFTGNRTKNISRSCLLILTYINKETYHTVFSTCITKIIHFYALIFITKCHS